MEADTKYKIIVILGTVTLTFRNVEGYNIKGNLIEFVDKKTNKLKYFDTRNCDITEEGDNNEF